MAGTKRRKKSGFLARFAQMSSALRWMFRLALLLIIVDLVYLVVTWPNWKAIASGPIPKSSFMQAYELKRVQDKKLPPLRWRTVSFSEIPKALVRAVILAEDARFYQHSGFDLIAFKEAMNYNLAEGRIVLGASTISQQTVKNLFLSPARNPIRKWHELALTWGMEQHLSKRRILELYLNIAEFGTGIYGVQAASLTYFGVPVSQLNLNQIAQLAATLPGPRKHNPATRTKYFQKRAHKILNLLLRYPGDAVDSIPHEPLAPPREEDDEPSTVETAPAPTNSI